MITAEEAAKIADEVVAKRLQEQSQRQLIALDTQLQIQARAGTKSLTTQGLIPEVISELKSSGYDVKDYSGHPGWFIIRF
jgi:hypothetical protein